MSGALTQSAAIGVAQDAIGTLPGLSPAEVKTQENLVAVGYAVTYPLGTILCAMLLANVLPRLYRRDLAKESAELAAELDAPDESPDEGEGYYEVVLRAYSVQRPDLVGRSVADFEEQQKALGRRVYLTGIRRDGTVLEHDQSRVLRLGDTVAVSAIRGDLVEFDARTHIGSEADDVTLLGYRTETLHVVVSEKAQLGRTVEEVRREPFMVGVYIDRLYRAGAVFPYRLSTKLERGDTLVLTGPERLVGPAGKALGKPVPTSFATDMVWVGLGIFLGGCIGIPALTAGGVPISLSTSGGGLIMGLVFGWIRGKYPTYGNVPPGAQWFMDTLGLCLFVAVVGINAGPGFTSGLSTVELGAADPRRGRHRRTAARRVPGRALRAEDPLPDPDGRPGGRPDHHGGDRRRQRDLEVPDPHPRLHHPVRRRQRPADGVGRRDRPAEPLTRYGVDTTMPKTSISREEIRSFAQLSPSS